MRQQREREIGSVFHMLCPRSIGPLTPPPPPPPPHYSHYLSRRLCNSRFRCTQLFNTTLPSFLNNWNLLNGAQTHNIWLLWAAQKEHESSEYMHTNRRIIATAPIRLRRCAGWNEPLLTAHAQQDVFSWQFMIWCYNGRVKRIDFFYFRWMWAY